ncbi:hypothetical protein H1235_07780 [Pseudoxanthomonas sp. NC8]|nr:hypothetical protein H1235_07780 [Pseudoxanthomonas sp. NC8]
MDVAIYAHGGLNNEDAAAEAARLWVPKLYDEKIFPVFLMWETGAIKTVTNIIEDKIAPDQARAAGGWQKVKDGWKEWWNQRVEGIARPLGRPLWNEMKQNAARISTNPGSGVRLLFDLYKAKGKEYGLPKIRLHLVGHSAGGILHSHPGRRGNRRRLRPAFGQPARTGGAHRRVRPHPRQGGAEDRHQAAGRAPDRRGRALRPDLQAVRPFAAVPGLAFVRGQEGNAVAGPGTRHRARARDHGLGRADDGRGQPELGHRPAAQRDHPGRQQQPPAAEATTHGSMDDDKALQRLVFDLIRKS